MNPTVKINASLTPEQNLISLINENNPDAQVREGDVTFSTATEVTDQKDYNTQVVATATVNANFYGDTTFNYTRVEPGKDTLEDPANVMKTPFPFTATTTEAELLSAVAARWGLIESEITITPKPWFYDGFKIDDGVGVFAWMEAKPESLIYVGTNIPVPLVYAEPPLSTVVTVTNLDGFEVKLPTDASKKE